MLYAIVAYSKTINNFFLLISKNVIKTLFHHFISNGMFWGSINSLHKRYFRSSLLLVVPSTLHASDDNFGSTID